MDNRVTVISDCLINKMDEGCIKVASSLAKRLKENKGAFLISCGKSDYADKEICTNRMFTNKEIYDSLRNESGPIVYVPFSSNSKGGIIRTFFLAKKSKKNVYSLFALRHHMDFFFRMAFKFSGAGVLTLSKDSYNYYSKYFGNRVTYIKTGIDLDKFTPVTEDRKKEIRKHFGFNPDDKIILHVGHLKDGRNIDKLLNISDEYKVVLVVSSVTEKDNELEAKLREKKNITIIDEYIPQIEEIYQMADVYLFPVQEKNNAIDVPLSVLEAAACNLPIVCTKYGELKEFTAEDGFCFIDNLEAESLNQSIEKMIGRNNNNRNAVNEYDWKNAVELISTLE